MSPERRSGSAVTVTGGGWSPGAEWKLVGGWAARLAAGARIAAATTASATGARRSEPAARESVPLTARECIAGPEAPLKS